MSDCHPRRFMLRISAFDIRLSFASRTARLARTAVMARGFGLVTSHFLVDGHHDPIEALARRDARALCGGLRIGAVT